MQNIKNALYDNNGDSFPLFKSGFDLNLPS